MPTSTTAMNATTHPTSPALSRRAAARRRAAERRRPRLSRLLAWLLSAVLGSAGLAYAQVPAGALPSGGKVMVGSGQLQQAGSLLVVQQDTARLGLDWQSFNIGSGATVEFRQPGADSVALNRVLGHSGSQIFGQLRANGQVFLTNPHGVLFAPGAKVDVGGLVASTLDLSQEDFAAGRYSFGGSSTASVVNQGSLRANAGGYLALFGPQVSNEGDITVDAGSVVLASGSAATVSISGGGLISAVVSPGAAGSVANSGSIAADGGVVRLSAQSAQDIAASLVNNSGVIRAHTLQERHGEIWITGDQATNSGSLSADSSSNADAGRIVLQGGMQAGSVDVGGTLSATSAGGRGGRVDTSAARVAVDADTRVDTRGGAGRHGHWTIDPTDFTVSAGSGSATASGIGASTLATNLGSTNVTLATAPAGSEAGDIHVNADVAWSAGTTLTLQAAHDTLESRVAERTQQLSLANTALATEVDNRKVVEQSLRDTQHELVHAAKMAVLGQISAGLAHELNQPLAALRTLSDNAAVLMDKQRLPETRANLQRISHLVGRLGELTRRLKTFAHKPGDQPVATPLAAAVANAQGLLAERLRRLGVQVQVEIAPDTPDVLADPGLIEQVLVNLMVNALDAMAGAPQRRLRIHADADAGLVRLAVSDSGPGITPQMLPRLFEPFATSKPPGAGLGLGLMISRRIVREFGGELSATQNGSEGGATFVMTLPVAPAAAPAPIPAPVSTSSSPAP